MASLLNKPEFFVNNFSAKRNAVLDIGCGSGILAFELAQHYDMVVGIDISLEMLAIAKTKRAASNIEYICMDADRIVFDRQFDLIVSSATFHHLKNLPATLEKLKTLLNPGGKVVLRDNVSEVETPATIVYIIGAFQDFLPDCLKYGLGTAWRMFKFRTSQPWLNHLASDKYLSEGQFKEIYGRIFPHCRFTKLGCFMGVIWEYQL